MGPEQWELGRTLQDAREKQGMSLRGTARAADMSDGWIRQIEYGWRTRDGQWVPVEPAPENLIRLAVVLDLDPHEILTAAGLATSSEEIERETARTLLDQVPEDKMIAAVAFLRGLVAGS